MLHLVLAPLLLLALQASSADEALQLFKRAVQLQESGNLEGAVQAYEQFLEAHPSNVEARSNLGVVFARLGRFDAAIGQYRKALEYTPGNASIRMNLALAFYKSGRYPDALEAFEDVLATNPGHPQVLQLKADALLQLGRYKEAVAVLRPLEATHADDRLFNYILGMALLRDGQTADGLKRLDVILRDGDTAEARLLMGIAKRAGADFAGARDDFKAAVERNPELPLAWSLYGQMLLTTGDRDAARAAFARELASNPGDFESNLYLGVIHKEDRDFEAARTLFERALAARPADPGVRYQLATLFLGTGENERALALLEPLVKESPDFLEARVSLATVYYRLKRKEDGDRQRAAAEELRAAAQARQPGAIDPTAASPAVPPSPTPQEHR